MPGLSPTLRQGWTCAALAVGTLLAGVGAAEAADAERGLKIGEGRLHPGIAVDTDYDTNVNGDSTSLKDVEYPAAGTDVRDPSARQIVPRADLRSGFKPSLEYALEGRTLNVSLSGYGKYTRYWGLGARQLVGYPGRRTGGSTSELSNFSGGAATAWVVNPKGNYRLLLNAEFERSQDPVAIPLTGGENSAGDLIVRDTFPLEARLDAKPGGGALSFEVGVRWSLDKFRNAPLSFLDGYTLSPGVGARWRFLPKTALVATFDYETRRYLRDTKPNPAFDPNQEESDANPANIPGPSGSNVFRSLVGLFGQVTSRVSVAIGAGWIGGTTGSSVGARAEATWKWSDATQFRLGGERNKFPSTFYPDVTANRVYAGGKLGLLGGRVSVGGEAGLDYLVYGAPDAAECGTQSVANVLAADGFCVSTLDRRDPVVKLLANVDYTPRPWLTLGLRLPFTANTSVALQKTAVATQSGGSPDALRVDAFSYTRFAPSLFVNIVY